MHPTALGSRAALCLAVTTLIVGCGGEPDVGLLGTDGAASAVATQLAFTAQPSAASAGASITPAVKVTAQDAQGNPVTTFTGNITVAIGANPSTGVLAGTKTKKAVAGVATFAESQHPKEWDGLHAHRHSTQPDFCDQHTF